MSPSRPLSGLGFHLVAWQPPLSDTFLGYITAEHGISGYIAYTCLYWFVEKGKQYEPPGNAMLVWQFEIIGLLTLVVCAGESRWELFLADWGTWSLLERAAVLFLMKLSDWICWLEKTSPKNVYLYASWHPCLTMPRFKGVVHAREELPELVWIVSWPERLQTYPGVSSTISTNWILPKQYQRMSTFNYFSKRYLYSTSATPDKFTEILRRGSLGWSINDAVYLMVCRQSCSRFCCWIGIPSVTPLVFFFKIFPECIAKGLRLTLKVWRLELCSLSVALVFASRRSVAWRAGGRLLRK